MKLDLSNIRRDFKQQGLSRKDLSKDPIAQFYKWFEDVIKFNLLEPNAMILATANDDIIDIRTVLLKYFDEKGFVFFTNYNSNKSSQIQKRAQASLLFSWLDLERQVKVIGKVEKISSEESSKYFSQRPKKSQIAALASKQSKIITSKDILLKKFADLEKKFADNEVNYPDFWGGYRVIPDVVEFWQGGSNRLHDRFVYKKNAKGWIIDRLSP